MWLFKKALDIFLPSSEESVLKPHYHIMLAAEKTKKLLRTKGLTFRDVCLAVECAETYDQLYEALIPFDQIMRIFKRAVANDDHQSDIVEVFKSFHCTEMLSFHLVSKGSIVDGIFSYKTAVIKKLEGIYERLEQYRRCDTAFNMSLLSLKTAHSFNNGQLRCESPARKRVFSLVSNVVSENFTQNQDLCLRPPLLREALTCKKRKLNSHLTALATCQSAELSVPSYTQNQESGLRQPLLREALTCKKRKIKARLTALANMKSAELIVPSYSDSVQPVSQVPSSKKRSRWDDGNCVCKPNCSSIQNGVMFFQNDNGKCGEKAECNCRYVHY